MKKLLIVAFALAMPFAVNAMSTSDADDRARYNQMVRDDFQIAADIVLTDLEIDALVQKRRLERECLKERQLAEELLRGRALLEAKSVAKNPISKGGIILTPNTSSVVLAPYPQDINSDRGKLVHQDFNE